jgi:hypothetical protein
MMVGDLVICEVKGYIDKARPDNSHGFTALGLYECSEDRKIAAQSWIFS